MRERVGNVFVDMASVSNILNPLQTPGKSLMYELNNKGPKTEPRGTPTLDPRVDDETLPTLTHWVPPSRYNFKKVRDSWQK